MIYADTAAEIADRQQHLLAVAPNAEHDQQRDAGRLRVEPHPHDGAVEDQAKDVFLGERAPATGVPVGLDLAPGAADDILGHGIREPRRRRPADAAGVGAAR